MHSNEKLIIGRDMPWHAIEGEVFRVNGFTPLSAVDAAGKVEAPPIPFSYGALDVDSPILNRRASMPVNHRIDYLNFWDLDRAQAITPGYHLLVTFLPYRGFLGSLLRLFTPPLHLLVMSDAKVEHLFANFVAGPKLRYESNRYLFANPTRCKECASKLYSFQTRCDHCKRPLYRIVK